MFCGDSCETVPLLKRNEPEFEPAGRSPLKKLENHKRVNLSSHMSSFVYAWENLNVYVNSGTGFTLEWQRRSADRKHILKNVWGAAHSGEILAILGPSGAGKSTLMNALTLRANSTGFRYLNGCVVRNNRALARLYAFVEQNTLFMGTLTVREHLIFHAMMRMSRAASLPEKITRVEEVISQLGLEKCKDVMIGCLSTNKGISGGEMKRLAFATEVLTDPPLMFCDEPTSGLDSFSALNLTRILREMAESGKTVICTVHQPSSEMFSLFDKLLVLSEGRVAYFGSASKLSNFFFELNLTSDLESHPPNNVVDVFIELLSIVPNREENSRENINFICDYFDDSIYGREIESELDYIRRTCFAGDIFGFIDVTVAQSKATWMTQFEALCWRSWLNVIKEPMLLKVRIFQTAILSIAVGLIYQHQKMDENGAININGVLFTFLTTMTFQNMFAVINVFCSELPLFLKEQESDLYGVSVYFLSKTLAEIPVFVMIPTIFTTVVYFWVGLVPGLANFFYCVLILILVTNSATSFGYMVSCSSKNVLMALSVGPPVIIPLLLFGGYLLNVESIPFYFKWLSYLSWFMYGNEALFINQWAHVENINCASGINSSCPKNGKAILESYHFRIENFTWDLAFLGILIVMFRLLAYLALIGKVICRRKNFCC